MTDDGKNGDDVQTNFIEELYDKFLECQLCSRTYSHPKMLICQHTFCADCLEAHYEMDEQDRPYRFLLSHNRDLSCPCCRARTPLPTGGVWRLPDNFLVAKLTDVIQRRGPAVAAKSGGGGCEICCPISIVWNDDRSGSVDDSRQQAATVKCVDCNKLLCADCAELHRETKVTASHALFTISDNRDVECKIHRNETLRFYCEPCEQCVCVLCALHEHNEHEVSSLADGLERHRGTFDTLLDDCKTRIDAVRQQLTLADAFKSSLSAAEDHIRHSAIDAIAAVRQRERELLDGLRSYVGDDAMRFLDERDALGVRLAELDNVCETMIGRTSVELLVTKKDVHERLHTALGRQQIQTPDTVRLGGVHYVAGAKPFHDLHRPTSDTVKLFRSVTDNDDVRDHAAENHVTDRSSEMSSSSSDSETDSDDSDNEDRQRQPGTLYFVSELPQVEYINLVARSKDESETEEDSDDDDDDDDSDDEEDKNETAAPITKICISDGVVRRMVIKSQSLCDTAEDSAPPPRPSGRKIPDFSRPKPVVKYVDSSTEMERVETTDAATATPRVVVCDKETYTGYVYLVHKNVSTDNQGTADKGTSMVPDVAAAFRNVSNSGRSTTFTRGTNTLKAMTSDRASSPIAALRSPTVPTNPSADVAKVPAYPTNQKSGSVQVPLTTQKSTTSDAVSVTNSQISAVAGKVAADAQKTPGSANMALQVPQVTSLTSPTASSQPLSTTTSILTTSQKQTMPVVSPYVPAGPTSSKLPPFSQKLAMSSTAVSASLPPIAATAPSQSVTSPPQVMTSSVAVSTPSQQKLPQASTSCATLRVATATPSTMRINSPTVAVACASTTSTMTSTTVQKPITSSKDVLSKDSPSPSTQFSATNAAPQPALSTDISQSANNDRIQTVSPKPSAVTSPVITGNKQIASPSTSATGPVAVAAAAIMSPLPASIQKLLTPEQASWSQQSQPSPSRSSPAALPSQSALDTASVAQPVATASSSQITSPATQISNVMQQRTSSTALTSSVPQKTLPPTSQSMHTPTTSAIDTMATSDAHKLRTSALSQFQPTSITSSINVTSTTPVQSQPQTTSSSSPASNTVTSSTYVSKAAQKPVTSSVSPTMQPQWPTPLTTGIMTAAQSMTSQGATHYNNVSNATASTPLVSTTTQNWMTAITLSPAQMSASTTAQKPVTSLALSTTHSQRPTLLTTTAQSMTSQAATSNNHLLNASTSMSLVSTIAQKSMAAIPSSTQISASSNMQKLMTSNNGQLEAAACVTSPSSPPSAATVENLAATATTHLAVTSASLAQSMQISASRMTSPTTVSNSTRPRSVFRSISMDNIRAPAPVLRPPPPIMTTSVAAVTQRLNGGATNGSAKNSWQSNR